MRMDRQFDLVVLGSGPAGEGAAMAAAKLGFSVGMVDLHRDVGGGCVHWGTIPSKTLRHVVGQLGDVRRNPLLRSRVAHLQIDYPELLHAAEEVVTRQAAQRHGYYDRNSVPVFNGLGQFVDPHTVEVVSGPDAGQRLVGKRVLISVGSRPYHPPELDFSHPRIHDSDSILRLKDTPKSLIVYGAGVIGCEYASIFRSMGVRVDLVNTRSRLLSFLDDEISDALAYHFRQQGATLRHNETFERVVTSDSGVVLHLESGKQIKGDYLLWANGRSGNTADLGLDVLGIKANSRAQLEVNENYSLPSQPHIYAAGDVVGMPGLASASYHQGRYAAAHALTGRAEGGLLRLIPTGIYTHPEISCIGRSEQELTAEAIPYEVGHALFRNLARAQIANWGVGMLKLLFHRETLEILGVHCFGYQAAEIVHIGQAVMAQEGSHNSLRYFIDSTFNYPTMAEAYRVAALNGYNRL